MSDPQLHLLLNRINELTARAEAAEAERDALRAERVAGIRVGRAILRAMGEALPPHWDHDEGDSSMGGSDG